MGSRQRTLRPGRFYRHYKGGVYKVMHCGRHTETLEELVVYASILTGDVWIREKKQFLETLPDGSNRFEEVMDVSTHS
jgi:hypothetical protein